MVVRRLLDSWSENRTKEWKRISVRLPVGGLGLFGHTVSANDLFDRKTVKSIEP